MIELLEKDTISVQITLTAKDVEPMIGFKHQNVSKDLFANNKCISLLPFVETWPIVIASPTHIKDSSVITLCLLPNELSQKLAKAVGHVLLNLLYDLDTGDWVMHWEDGEYEYTNPNPPDPNVKRDWVRENTTPISKDFYSDVYDITTLLKDFPDERL
jgi:hypothetical protein